MHDPIGFFTVGNEDGGFDMILYDELTLDLFVRDVKNTKNSIERRIRFTLTVIEDILLGDDDRNVTDINIGYCERYQCALKRS